MDAAAHAYSMVSVPLYDTLGPDTGAPSLPAGNSTRAVWYGGGATAVRHARARHGRVWVAGRSCAAAHDESRRAASRACGCRCWRTPVAACGAAAQECSAAWCPPACHRSPVVRSQVHLQPRRAGGGGLLGAGAAGGPAALGQPGAGRACLRCVYRHAAACGAHRPASLPAHPVPAGAGQDDGGAARVPHRAPAGERVQAWQRASVAVGARLLSPAACRLSSAAHTHPPQRHHLPTPSPRQIVYGGRPHQRLPEAPGAPHCRIMSLDRLRALGYKHPKPHHPPKVGLWARSSAGAALHAGAGAGCGRRAAARLRSCCGLC